jgi:hypothetical protein
MDRVHTTEGERERDLTEKLKRLDFLYLDNKRIQKGLEENTESLCGKMDECNDLLTRGEYEKMIQQNLDVLQTIESDQALIIQITGQ